MAQQSFSSSHNLTVKQWSEGLEAEALKKISFTGLIGKRSDSLIQWKDTLSKKAGDNETIGLRYQLEGAPKSSTDTVENNEQTLEIHDMSFTIDEVVDAVRFKNVIDRQRVTFDMRDEAKAALAENEPAAAPFPATAYFCPCDGPPVAGSAAGDLRPCGKSRRR